MKVPSSQAEILIVGAGPTGLTLACELLRRKIACRIIDKRTMPSSHPKALGVSSTSLMIFEKLGFAREIIQAGIKMEDTYFFWNKKPFLHINYRFLKETTRYPFMLLLPQTETEKYLRQCLKNLGGKIEWGVSLKNLIQNQNEVIATLDSEKNTDEVSSYKEIIGCDGAKSTVRELLNISFTGKDYGLHFIYADVEVEGQLADSNIANYYVEGSHLLIIVPLPKGQYRIVASVEGEKSKRPLPTLQEIQKHVGRYYPGNIKFKKVIQLGSVPIYYRLANQNRIENIYLVGDAFHLFSPLGGQGMNTGIQDAYNLAWKLTYVKKGWATTVLLDSYESERLLLVKKLIQEMENTIHLLVRDDKDQDELAKKIVPSFSNRKTFKNIIPRNYSGLNYCYPMSEFTQDKLSAKNGPIAGQYTDHFSTLHQVSDHRLIFYINNHDFNHDNQFFKEGMKDYPFISTCYESTTTSSYFSFVRPDGYIAYQDKIQNGDNFGNYLKKFYKTEEILR